MKRYLILSFILLGLIACDSGGGNVAGGGTDDVTEETVVLGRSPEDDASHEAAFGHTAPILGKEASKRFDEDGNLIGVYAIPYVPSKGNQ